MEAFKPYAFNIVNMEKHNSQYRSGMKPIVFSVKAYAELKRGWRRAGTDICYYGNHYKSGNKTHGSYMTASFTIQFPFDRDVCYVAYVYPYTYSTLLVSAKTEHRYTPEKKTIRIENPVKISRKIRNKLISQEY